MSDQPDIVLPRQPVTLRCPVCGLTRNLPTNWWALLAADAPDDWDGLMRCVKDDAVMVEVVTTDGSRGKPDGPYQ
jgi:hypothetical protein